MFMAGRAMLTDFGNAQVFDKALPPLKATTRFANEPRWVMAINSIPLHPVECAFVLAAAVRGRSARQSCIEEVVGRTACRSRTSGPAVHCCTTC